MLVIDADGHVEASVYVDWDRFAPEPHASAITRLARRKFDLVGDITGLRRGMWEPADRLRDMDEEGIDVAVLFGGLVGLSFGPEFAGVRGPAQGEELAFACHAARAYNNWLSGYCAEAPDRLKGVALLPWMDAQEASRELERAVKQLGFVAGLIPVRLGEKSLDDSHFVPLYETAERLDVALAVHAPGLVTSPHMHTHFRRHAFDFVAALMEGLMAVICGGVLERYKRLRLGFFEGECGWVPFWLDRLDDHYEDLSHQVSRITREPSSYFAEGRIYLSCEPKEKSLPYVLSRLGDECVVYASDYAHYDCLFPDSMRAIRRRKDIASAAKTKILGANAARLYGIR
ncbi:MAG: amidohydrolase family protein [Chloroflexi bacterium]|nr:amidohydrolase family protein [Chloroflexota bacterium]